MEQHSQSLSSESERRRAHYGAPELEPYFVYLEDDDRLQLGDEYWNGKTWHTSSVGNKNTRFLVMNFPYRRLRVDFFNF